MQGRSSFRLRELRASVKPFRLHFFSRLRSTNDHAAVLRKRGELFAPAIVLTSHQMAGRGRGANTWFSSRGVLTATFVFPIEHHLAPHQIPLVAGLAVRDAAAEVVMNSQIQLKWPNDILHDNKKLAGILCERVHQADFIGVGLNVNLSPRDTPASLRSSITSLSQIASCGFDMTAVLIALAQHLHHALSRRGQRPFGETLRRYDECHGLLNRRVTITTSGEEAAITGHVQGLDREGRLLLRTRAGSRAIIAGHVQLL
jgi:BirA family biotin operon repressor/biotin-[acetyl-CoA-carboxylase] ligase